MTGLNHLSDHCIYQFYLFNYNRVLRNKWYKTDSGTKQYWKDE